MYIIYFENNFFYGLLAFTINNKTNVYLLNEMYFIIILKYIINKIFSVLSRIIRGNMNDNNNAK